MTKETSDILSAGGRLFKTKSYAATTVREIAAEVGILPGSLHYRFSTKEEILTALMEAGQKRAIQRLKMALDGIEDPELRFRRAVQCHMETLYSPDDAVHALLYEWRSIRGSARRRIVRLRDQYETIWVSILENARDAGVVATHVNLRMVRLFILGALNWTPQWFGEAKGMSKEQIAREMSNIVLDGIRLAATSGAARDAETHSNGDQK